MSKAEMINWFFFAVGAIAAAAVYVAYRKSAGIIQPGRKPGVAYSPDQYRLASETVEFVTADGVRLKGWFIPAPGEENGRTIIFCHGWGSNRGEMLRDTWFLAERGFNLFYFDFRASGESKGSLSSVGYLETRDFDAAYEFLKNNRPYAAESVGVFGTSMGGSVAVYAAAKYPELACVLAENTFLSYNKVVACWSWNRLKTPYFPLVALTLFFVRRKLKADPEPYSPLYNAGKVKMPAMFIYGDHDDLVPAEDAERLFGLCPSEKKQMWTIAGASHAKCAEVGGEVYRQKVSAFFAEHLREPEQEKLPAQTPAAARP
ncbi:MAG: alpha/beta fold hydrolase [Elusimicrobiales bacterium]|nr:alpha/beta fold hydrolase [Elusimicrobiales bacterium]